MLAVSTLTSNKDGNNKGSTMEANYSMGIDDFPDFSGTNLLDSIDFDELFMGMHDGDVLPDLDEMDQDLLVDFSISTGEDDSASEFNNSSSAMSVENIISSNSDDGYIASVETSCYEGRTNDVVISRVLGTEPGEKDGDGCGLKTPSSSEEGIVESKKDIIKSESTRRTTISSSKESHNSNTKKSSLSSKSGTNNNSNHQGKRKTKVDWTPELHRRFVQAVEQLGVDKAVPSRILELMGIDCLTRHNIASHLQKYRSHRKHLLAREAEAASWTQKRQLYGVAMGGGGKGGPNISPWYPPTMGFPTMTTPMHPPFRPLHVWGHPTMNPQARLHLWPKHVAPSTTPLPPTWAPPPPPPDPSFWRSPHQRRAAVAPVPVIPPHNMYRPDQQGLRPPPTTQSAGPHPPVDIHPSKESIDSAIGDVLAKPWLPLPIGLKPPSMDSVMVELQRQGIPKIPPSCA